MIKKFRAIFALTSFLVIVFLMEPLALVKVADANPYYIYETVDPIKGAIPPQIAIFTPQNHSVYTKDKVSINFSVPKPQLDSSVADNIHLSGITILNVNYTLDGNLTKVYDYWNVAGHISEYNASFISPSLADGNHKLTVQVSELVLINDGEFKKFYLNSSSTTSFTVTYNKLTPSPTPTPTVPEFPSVIAITLLIMMTLAVAVVFRRKI